MDRGLDLVVIRDEDAPVDLLDACHSMVLDAFGSRFSPDDWHHTLGGWRIVATDAGTVVGHAAVIPRPLLIGDRPVATGYLEAMATAPARHGTGVGTAVLAVVNDVISTHFDLGALSTSRPTFYERQGWQRWQGPSYVLDGQERIRTADEDAGLMVLRLGPTADLDLTNSITCGSRPGDDW